ncbi:hypothetical protein [Treponema primitia]|uniref:hypothetical protein n=1 Tax=Treponema primitia TaxID=88058 RepID=UPI0002555050|nr:hypothetical protein [Treponema primitia]
MRIFKTKGFFHFVRKASIKDAELKNFKRLAKKNLGLTEKQIEILIKAGELKEIE